MDDIASLIKAGFSSTGPTAALFVFSVLYFVHNADSVTAFLDFLDGGRIEVDVALMSVQ